MAERWSARPALEDWLGVAWDQINADRLYRGLDELPAHKEQRAQHWLQRWFVVGFEFLIYDVTSMVFAGQVKSHPKPRAVPAALRAPVANRCASDWGGPSRRFAAG